MPQSLRLALAQLNPSVGDFTGNVQKLLTARREAARLGAELVMTSELFVTGYPADDLMIRPDFLEQSDQAVAALAAATADESGPGIVVGAPWRKDGHLFNAALLLDGGRVAARVLKHDLPNYGCFDEKRFFEPGPLPDPVEFHGYKLGIMLCEDMWLPAVASHLALRGADALLVINGSPYERGKPATRLQVARARVRATHLPLAYVNQWGGQDELVFDGTSFVLDAAGQTMIVAPAWQDDLLLSEWHLHAAGLAPRAGRQDVAADGVEADYRAIVTGLRDYMRKNTLDRVWIGLSGGIDSALVAALAVDALGADRVRTVMMPSRITSQANIDDAEQVAARLGCRHDVLPIPSIVDACADTLAAACETSLPGMAVAHENLQARSRGMLLMALANAHGGLVLATGNKSELATGYATLYGDMCGGYAPLKDVYKTRVYAMARMRNAGRPEGCLGPSDDPVIPDRILSKPPSAELKPDQTDQDTLPPYDILDAILEGLIEEDRSPKSLVESGHDAASVAKVWSMLTASEHKRRQAPPGPKVTIRHLGRDRRYPVTSLYATSKDTSVPQGTGNNRG